MAIKEYSPENVPGNGRAATPKIGFQKSGMISFNKLAAEMLKVKDGDTVKLLQDDVETEDWYIIKSAGGFRIRALNDDYFGFSSQGLKKILFASLSYEKVSLTVPIRNEPVKVEGEKAPAFLILTAARPKD